MPDMPMDPKLSEELRRLEKLNIQPLYPGEEGYATTREIAEAMNISIRQARVLLTTAARADKLDCKRVHRISELTDSMYRVPAYKLKPEPKARRKK